jgi:metal-responsive CopG/Arc/MetJ family transcriptional regulator
MNKTKGSGKGMKVQSASTVRASISFPPDIYESLEKLAKKKKVSLAWVVRDAAERYIADRSADAGGVIEKTTSRKKTND